MLEVLVSLSPAKLLCRLAHPKPECVYLDVVQVSYETLTDKKVLN